MKSSSKNVTKVTKNVREHNLLQIEQKMLQREQKCSRTEFIPNRAKNVTREQIEWEIMKREQIVVLN